jgi:hypothetical protein
VNAVMNVRFLKMLGNYRVTIQLVAPRVVLSSTELAIIIIIVVIINYLNCCCTYK